MDKQMTRRDFVAGAAAGAMAAAGMASLASADEAAPDQVTWDREVDFLVLGSGTAIWGAIAAKVLGGLEDVLVVEKSGVFGGSAATSGGNVYIYNSYVWKERGYEETPEEFML